MNFPTENTMHVFDGANVRYLKQYGSVLTDRGTMREWNGTQWVLINNPRTRAAYARWIEQQETF